MSRPLLLQYEKCSTCRKAKAWLDQQGVDYDTRPIREENPTFEELKAWTARSGLPLTRFFNTSGQLYRSLDLKNRLPELSEEEQLRLLASDGMLVRRPLLVCGDAVCPGFRAAEWEQALAQL